MNKVINQIAEILKDKSTGCMTDEEMKNALLESEWRDMVIKENIQAQVVNFMAPDEYRNARGFKRLRYIRIYNIVLDTRVGINLPEHEIEALARCFLPDILAFFESEEGKAAFAIWKAEYKNTASLPSGKNNKKIQAEPMDKRNLEILSLLLIMLICYWHK